MTICVESLTADLRPGPYQSRGISQLERERGAIADDDPVSDGQASGENIERYAPSDQKFIGLGKKLDGFTVGVDMHIFFISSPPYLGS
jgi:hypothetical protein